jgi:hypothetical protein
LRIKTSDFSFIAGAPGKRRTREFCKRIKWLASLATGHVGRNVGRIVGRFFGGDSRRIATSRPTTAARGGSSPMKSLIAGLCRRSRIATVQNKDLRALVLGRAVFAAGVGQHPAIGAPLSFGSKVSLTRPTSRASISHVLASCRRHAGRREYCSGRVASHASPPDLSL